jgi:predicted SAM-dependent methyltransferase
VAGTRFFSARALREFAKRRMSANLRRALRALLMEIALWRRHRSGVRAAGRVAGVRPLRLNLGSGFQPKAGWINIDLSDRATLTLDLREPLPFRDNSVETIYSEHFFEHLNYAQLDDPAARALETPSSLSEALTFLRECRRVLVSGGVLDLVVPDAECIVREYAARHRTPFPAHGWWGPAWCDTPLHCVNYVFRQGSEHKYAYDEETLASVLADAGFVNVRRRPFDASVDAPNHEIGSLCVLARKSRPQPESDTHALEVRSEAMSYV